MKKFPRKKNQVANKHEKMFVSVVSKTIYK